MYSQAPAVSLPACLPHRHKSVLRAQLCSMLIHGSSLPQTGVPAPGPCTWASSVQAPLTFLPPTLPALSPSLTDLLTAPSGHTWLPRWAHPPPHLGTAQPHPRALRGCHVLYLLRKSSCRSLSAPHLWQHVSSLADGDWCSSHGQTAGSPE